MYNEKITSGKKSSFQTQWYIFMAKNTKLNKKITKKQLEILTIFYYKFI